MKKRVCVFLICTLILSGAVGCDNGDETANTGANISSGFETEIASDLTDDEKTGKSDIENDEIAGGFEYASDDNLLETMSEDERYKINAFLSNFSEGQYRTGKFYKTEDMINFAFVHNSIHNEDFKKIVENGRYAIEASLVDTTLKKFFGRSVLHETPEGSKVWEYENGRFTVPISDGESCAYFTTVTCVRSGKDGSYEALFSVFFNANDSLGDVDSQWYAMTASEAAQYFEFCYDGTAVLKSSGDSYELLSYKTN